jgi:hypothetical protein
MLIIEVSMILTGIIRKLPVRVHNPASWPRIQRWNRKMFF